MSQDKKYFEELLDNYLANEASSDEWITFMELVKSGEYDELLKQKIDDVLAKRDEGVNISPDRAHDLLFKILTAEKHTAKLIPIKRPRKRFWTAAAAIAFVMLISAGGYFYFNSNSQKQPNSEILKERFKNDVAAPGDAKAMITLADGTIVPLDSIVNGTLATQGNIKVIKTEDGKIIYQVTDNTSPNEIKYNTLSNPRGSNVINMMLADGSRVWLNAGSSVTYPVVFMEKERRIEMTGEAYFEIAHNAAKPFSVFVDGMQVQVLGTHFNINAYDDENIMRTTLLQGSVKILSIDKSPVQALSDNYGVIIKPGEQAELDKNNSTKTRQKIKVQKADVEQAVAWKNGSFIFQGNNIQSVMRQLARWYNVDVTYEGNIPGDEFVGDITQSRYENISQILKVLEKTKTVSFAVKGRSITVMPYRK